MKKLSRIFSVILVLTLIVASVPAAYAAGTSPGSAVSVTFTFNNIYGVDGTFTYSNDSILTGVTYSDNGTMSGKVKNNMAYYYTNEASNLTITISAKVAKTAKNGDTCAITFKYRTSDANGTMSEWKTMTKTVKVEVHNCADNNKDHKCDSCGKKLTSCKDSNGDQKCDICGGYVAKPVDYTELNRQLGIAAGLKQGDYTSGSWATLDKAVAAGKTALKSSKQTDVDTAAKAVADAISGLVRMDYTKLQAALESVKGLGEDVKLGDLIDRLVAAIQKGQAALQSNDQAAVDAATAELETVVAELRKALADLGSADNDTDNIVDEKPDSAFCNISWHTLLLILLIVSAVLNVALVALLLKKKKDDESDQVQE